MAKLNNSILTHGVSFPYGNRQLGIARIRRLQFIASPTFGYSSLDRHHPRVRDKVYFRHLYRLCCPYLGLAWRRQSGFPLQAHLPHQPLNSAASDIEAFPLQLPPHLAHAVDTEVLFEDASDLDLKSHIPLRPCLSSARPSSRAFAVPAKVRQSTFPAPFRIWEPRSIRSAHSLRRESRRAKTRPLPGLRRRPPPWPPAGLPSPLTSPSPRCSRPARGLCRFPSS